MEESKLEDSLETKKISDEEGDDAEEIKLNEEIGPLSHDPSRHIHFAFENNSFIEPPNYSVKVAEASSKIKEISENNSFPVQNDVGSELTVGKVAIASSLQSPQPDLQSIPYSILSRPDSPERPGEGDLHGLENSKEFEDLPLESLENSAILPQKIPAATTVEQPADLHQLSQQMVHGYIANTIGKVGQRKELAESGEKDERREEKQPVTEPMNDSFISHTSYSSSGKASTVNGGELPEVTMTESSLPYTFSTVQEVNRVIAEQQQLATSDQPDNDIRFIDNNEDIVEVKTITDDADDVYGEDEDFLPPLSNNESIRMDLAVETEEENQQPSPSQGREEESNRPSTTETSSSWNTAVIAAEGGDQPLQTEVLEHASELALQPLQQQLQQPAEEAQGQAVEEIEATSKIDDDQLLAVEETKSDSSQPFCLSSDSEQQQQQLLQQEQQRASPPLLLMQSESAAAVAAAVVAPSHHHLGYMIDVADDLSSVTTDYSLPKQPEEQVMIPSTIIVPVRSGGADAAGGEGGGAYFDRQISGLETEGGCTTATTLGGGHLGGAAAAAESVLSMPMDDTSHNTEARPNNNNNMAATQPPAEQATATNDEVEGDYDRAALDEIDAQQRRPPPLLSSLSGLYRQRQGLPATAATKQPSLSSAARLGMVPMAAMYCDQPSQGIRYEATHEKNLFAASIKAEREGGEDLLTDNSKMNEMFAYIDQRCQVAEQGEGMLHDGQTIQAEIDAHAIEASRPISPFLATHSILAPEVPILAAVPPMLQAITAADTANAAEDSPISSSGTSSRSGSGKRSKNGQQKVRFNEHDDIFQMENPVVPVAAATVAIMPKEEVAIVDNKPIVAEVKEVVVAVAEKKEEKKLPKEEEDASKPAEIKEPPAIEPTPPAPVDPLQAALAAAVSKATSDVKDDEKATETAIREPRKQSPSIRVNTAGPSLAISGKHASSISLTTPSSATTRKPSSPSVAAALLAGAVVADDGEDGSNIVVFDPKKSKSFTASHFLNKNNGGSGTVSPSRLRSPADKLRSYVLGVKSIDLTNGNEDGSNQNSADFEQARKVAIEEAERLYQKREDDNLAKIAKDKQVKKQQEEEARLKKLAEDEHVSRYGKARSLGFHSFKVGLSKKEYQSLQQKPYLKPIAQIIIQEHLSRTAPPPGSSGTGGGRGSFLGGNLGLGAASGGTPRGSLDGSSTSNADLLLSSTVPFAAASASTASPLMRVATTDNNGSRRPSLTGLPGGGPGSSGSGSAGSAGLSHTNSNPNLPRVSFANKAGLRPVTADAHLGSSNTSSPAHRHLHTAQHHHPDHEPHGQNHELWHMLHELQSEEMIAKHFGWQRRSGAAHYDDSSGPNNRRAQTTAGGSSSAASSPTNNNSSKSNPSGAYPHHEISSKQGEPLVHKQSILSKSFKTMRQSSVKNLSYHTGGGSSSSHDMGGNSFHPDRSSHSLASTNGNNNINNNNSNNNTVTNNNEKNTDFIPAFDDEYNPHSIFENYSGFIYQDPSVSIAWKEESHNKQNNGANASNSFSFTSKRALHAGHMINCYRPWGMEKPKDDLRELVKKTLQQQQQKQQLSETSADSIKDEQDEQDGFNEAEGSSSLLFLSSTEFDPLASGSATTYQPGHPGQHHRGALQGGDSLTTAGEIGHCQGLLLHDGQLYDNNSQSSDDDSFHSHSHHPHPMHPSAGQHGHGPGHSQQPHRHSPPGGSNRGNTAPAASATPISGHRPHSGHHHNHSNNHHNNNSNSNSRRNTASGGGGGGPANHQQQHHPHRHRSGSSSPMIRSQHNSFDAGEFEAGGYGDLAAGGMFPPIHHRANNHYGEHQSPSPSKLLQLQPPKVKVRPPLVINIIHQASSGLVSPTSPSF